MEFNNHILSLRQWEKILIKKAERKEMKNFIIYTS